MSSTGFRVVMGLCWVGLDWTSRTGRGWTRQPKQAKTGG